MGSVSSPWGVRLLRGGRGGGVGLLARALTAAGAAAPTPPAAVARGTVAVLHGALRAVGRLGLSLDGLAAARTTAVAVTARPVLALAFLAAATAVGRGRARLPRLLRDDAPLCAR